MVELNMFRVFLSFVIMSFCTKVNVNADQILSEGMKAPMFELVDASMNVFKLSEMIGKKGVVLYFYPKDKTPGCTIEAKEFSSLIQDFEAIEVVVVGVSKDTPDCHKDFIKKSGLKINLLSDFNLEVAKQYGSYKKGLLSNINRDKFFINKEGVVEKIWRNVFSLGHAKDVLKYIDNKK